MPPSAALRRTDDWPYTRRLSCCRRSDTFKPLIRLPQRTQRTQRKARRYLCEIGAGCRDDDGKQSATRASKEEHESICHSFVHLTFFLRVLRVRSVRFFSVRPVSSVTKRSGSWI